MVDHLWCAWPDGHIEDYDVEEARKRGVGGAALWRRAPAPGETLVIVEKATGRIIKMTIPVAPTPPTC